MNTSSSDLSGPAMTFSSSRRFSALILIRAARDLALQITAFGSGGETCQDASPATLGIKDRTHHTSLVTVPIEMAMLEFETRPPRAVCDEGHLDFGLQRQVITPVRGDLPSEHESMRRLPREHLTPLAFRAVDTALVPATTNVGFDHGRSCRNLADMVSIQRPPLAVPFRENAEGVLNRRVEY